MARRGLFHDPTLVFADVAVLGADPVADIRNTRAIERVYREGVLAVSGRPAPAGSTCPAAAGST
jgi:hypothetical protein